MRARVAYQAPDPLTRVCHPCSSYRVQVFETDLLVTYDSNVITRACRNLDGKRLGDGLRMKLALLNSSDYLTKTPTPHHMQLFLPRKETDELSPKAIGCEYFYWNLTVCFTSIYQDILRFCNVFFQSQPRAECFEHMFKRREAIKGKNLVMNVKRVPSIK